MTKIHLFTRVFIALSVLASALSWPPTPAQAQKTRSAHSLNSAAPTNQIIIKFKTSAESAGLQAASAEQLSALSQTAGVALSYFRAMSGEAHVLKLPQALPYAEVQTLANKLAARPEVAYAEPDRRMFPMLTPDDTLYNEQWHYAEPTEGNYGANLPAAWDVITGSADIRIAVLDTGILSGHPDFADRLVSGYDFISDAQVGNDGNARDSNPEDPGDWITAGESASGFFAGCGVTDSSWHGTHVAGTIGAASNNGEGVAGINWVSKIQPVRVLGKCGGLTSDIADAIRWAAGQTVGGAPNNATPAQVINLSLGGFGPCSTITADAINVAVGAGAVVVVAAGNEADNAANYSPANCNNVITVAASNREGNRAVYSNYGPTVEITAPGGETFTPSDGVLSTLNEGLTSPGVHTYAFYQGTSMATPHVAGVVSLMLSINPNLSPALVRSLLQSTATPFPSGSTCNPANCGVGILNAAAAVQAAQNVAGFDKFLYLPLTARGPSAPVVPNGNFEQGAVAWAQYSEPGVTSLILSPSSTPEALPVAANSGAYAVWLGGLPNQYAFIEQTLTVQPSAPYLSYWDWVDSLDDPGYDFAAVLVNGDLVDEFTLSIETRTNGWVRHVINLNAYVGQTVNVRFLVLLDDSFDSSWFIDDVGFQATP